MMNRNIVIKIAAVVAYVAMVAVNAAANILPINNITTGAVSDSYPNLFAPAGITFSIWGLIYLLLGAYSVFQFVTKKDSKTQHFIETVSIYFILTSLINAVWIFAWHYRIIWLTVVLMLSLLICLIKIADVIQKEKLTKQEKWLIKVPFGVYFGWITIATIANITAFLVSIGWNGFELPDSTWMIIILIVGFVICSLTMLRYNNVAYGLVPVWAYGGILLKHTSPTGFNNAYPYVIITTSSLLVVLLLVNGYLLLKKRAL